MLTRLPLLVDVHFHARDFNQTDKGTFESETRAAVASGFGTVQCMPNTDPPILSLKQLEKARQIAEANAYCDIGFNFGTDGENFAEFDKVYDLVKALKVYLNPTTGDLEIKEWTKLYEIFRAWPGEKPVMVHAEEAEQVKLAIGLAGRFNKRVHICHVSSAGQVEEVREAKGLGFRVTAEVCPHHLIFTQDYLEKLGAYGLMKPPLGSLKDREEVWLGLEDGTIDIIATDHAPHTRDEKASDKPPFGVTGEQAFGLLWNIVHWNRSVEFLVDKMVTNPARIFDIKMDPRSYMMVDLDEEFIFDESMVHSKAGFSPYVGRRVRGRIHQVFLHGVEVVREGEILAREGRVIS